MNLLLALAIILPVLADQFAVGNLQLATIATVNCKLPTANSSGYSTVQSLPLPPGFERIPASETSFTAWLRNRALKQSNTVYLYNGMPKRNQQAQFAVLDISVGNEDLQQCADAVMRLRAEYLYDQSRWSEIAFMDNNRKTYRYQNGKDRAAFNAYLRKVFSWCGTASLVRQLKPVKMESIMPGDVLIKGGYPGHAVIVMDVATNRKGEKIYLLAQSYMPAQDIHILRNLASSQLSPWYKVAENQAIVTPEWVFEPGQLRRW
jgi:hypothetical protein